MGIFPGAGGRDLAGREFVIERQLLEGDVVGMDVPARFDADAGAADHLAIANDGFSGGNGAEGHFVTDRNRIFKRDLAAPGADRLAGLELRTRDGDVVGFVKMDDGVLRRGQWSDLEEAHF